VRIINLHLPPPVELAKTGPRQYRDKYSASAETSIDSENWISLFDGPADYLFDGSKGNMGIDYFG